MRVAVVDYGMGNLHSVRSALELFTDAISVVSEGTVESLLGYDRVILPGVGSFKRAMENIRARRLDSAIQRAATRGIPLVGICLGMQLLATRGTEDGESEGLGLIDGVVERLSPTNLPIPHIGFSSVEFTPSAGSLALGVAADFYFVHSYHLHCASADAVAGTFEYGGRHTAMVRRANVVGTQFHPEKSQSNGLKLLQALLKNTSW